jgi:hypothetical protein
MADIDPLAAGLYLVPPERRLIIPRGDTPELVPALHSACTKRGIAALLPTVDAELAPVAAARGRFESDGIALPISPVECLLTCRDKQLLMDAVRGQVPVPDSEPLTEAVAARADSFPRFAKPREGAGSRGIARIDSRADLARQPMDGSVMLQEYLPGEEYSVDVQSFVQVDLDAVVVGQHAEADRVLAAEEFLIGVEADVQMVVQQIVIGAVTTVFTSEELGSARWPLRRLADSGRRGPRSWIRGRGASRKGGGENERCGDACRHDRIEHGLPRGVINCSTDFPGSANA